MSHLDYPFKNRFVTDFSYNVESWNRHSRATRESKRKTPVEYVPKYTSNANQIGRYAHEINYGASQVTPMTREAKNCVRDPGIKRTSWREKSPSYRESYNIDERSYNYGDQSDEEKKNELNYESEPLDSAEEKEENTSIGIQVDHKDCFFSTVFQGLFSIPEFLDFFALEFSPDNVYEDNNQEYSPEKSLCENISAFCVEYLCSDEDWIDGTSFRSLFDEDFSPDKRHDVSDFLMYLLTKIKFEISSEKVFFDSNGYHNYKDACEAYEAINNTIVDNLFVGMYENEIKCNACRKITKNYEDFLNILLECDRYDPQAAFIKFCEIEKSSSSYYECEFCKQIGECQVRRRIVKFPKYLILKFDRQDHLNGRKMSGFMYYNTDFTHILPDTFEPVNYSLNSIMLHSGSWRRGSNSALCCRDDIWKLYDGTKVEEIDGKVADQKEAYILVYQKQEKAEDHL
ncbi:unnamed protein product [Moneuplotes crassus]|uniref:USP domain-containing protein n=1 Tax=Euplotes crassus TaxID=5936 RepID=A0AAD1UHC2_EUPCR|nr:unnamed protein product [Moneuplotes crassus]